MFEADRGEGVHTQGEREREINSGREDNRCRTGVCMQKCWFPFFYCSGDRELFLISLF